MTTEKLFRQSILWRSLFFLTAIITNILFARYFQASLSGTVLYLANVYALVALVGGLGLESALTYFSSKSIISFEKLSGFSAAWIVVATGIAFVATRYFIQPLYDTATFSIPTGKLALYPVVYISGLMLTSFFSVLFYSKGNYVLPNLILIVVNICLIIYIPKTLHFASGDDAVTDVYFYSTCAQGILLVLAFLIRYGYIKNISFPSLFDIKKLFRFSIVALGANIIFFLISRVDFFFVEKYCSKSDLGNYIQVSRLGQMLLIIPQILASVISPRTAGQSQAADGIIQNVTTLGRLFTWLFLLVFVVIAVTGKWLFPFLFGGSFDKMHVLMMIFLPGFFALSYLAIISAFFLGSGQLRINLTGTAIALAVVITGDILLVNWLGVFAAASISATAYLINLVYAISRFSKKFNIPVYLFFKFQKQDLIWLKAVVQNK